MASDVLTQMETALARTTPEAIGEAVRDVLAPLGVTYMQTRVYRRPEAPLTSRNHFEAGGVVSRFSRPGWVGSAAFNYICLDCNPLLDAIRGGRTRYRFSDFAPHGDRRFGDYWDALGEADMGEAVCATAYGADRRIASVHLGFGEARPEARRASMVQLAGQMLVERLMDVGRPPPNPDPAPSPRLTRRERDCLGFVAGGKSDWEISVILGLSEATARFHVDNARRKLGAVTRAQAVARLALRGEL